ncbi:hypothetical protein GCM10027422_23050 [Hymenobacter arcticus]
MEKSVEAQDLRVAALAGRRPDASDAKDIRFPLSNVTAVRKKLMRLFMDYSFTHLVCAAACGADLIALDVATELKMKRHIILPFSPADFRSSSVIDRPGDWGELYDKIIWEAKEANCLHLLGYSLDDNEAFTKTTQAIIDQAKELANDSLAFGVVVWEGHSRGDDDFTKEFAALSQKEGLHKAEILTI